MGINKKDEGNKWKGNVGKNVRKGKTKRGNTKRREKRKVNLDRNTVGVRGGKRREGMAGEEGDRIQGIRKGEDFGRRHREEGKGKKREGREG